MSTKKPWENNWTIVGDAIGAGGQGETFKVHRVDDAHVLAVMKRLKSYKKQKPRARMFNEVANLDRLKAEGAKVPAVIDHNTDTHKDGQDQLYVVMEFIDGPTVGDYVKQAGHLDVDSAIAIALEICKTVEIAHAVPIYHRDIKPGNVIVRGGSVGDIVTVDYGLSASGAVNEPTEGLTETDEHFRNEFMMLPEYNIAGEDKRDARSDLAQICGILFYCLTGKNVGLLDGRPHMRDDNQVRLFQQDDARVGRIDSLLTRGLAIAPGNRFQTAGDLREALESIASAPKHIDTGDPIQVAAILSERMTSHDRTTQLNQYIQEGRKLYKFVDDLANSYRGKLGQFKIHNEQSSIRPAIPKCETESGIEFVSRGDFSHVLEASHHPFRYHIEICIVAQGDQCQGVILEYFIRKVDAGIIRSAAQEHSTEIGWYKGDPEASFDRARNAFKDCITRGLNRLAAEIGMQVDWSNPGTPATSDST